MRRRTEQRREAAWHELYAASTKRREHLLALLLSKRPLTPAERLSAETKYHELDNAVSRARRKFNRADRLLDVLTLKGRL